MTAGPYGEGSDDSQRPESADPGQAPDGWSRSRRHLAVGSLLVITAAMIANTNGELLSAESGGRWLRTLSDEAAASDDHD